MYFLKPFSHFRKIFLYVELLAVQKVGAMSFNEKVISEVLMNQRVLMNQQNFDESTSFCQNIHAFLRGLYSTLLIQQGFD
jgi:hypothetical protein